PAALGHEGSEVLAEQVRGGEVDGDGPLVVVLGELGHGLADVVGRVVDQDVDPARLFAHAAHVLALAEVGADGGGGDAVTAQPGEGAVESFLAAGDDDDLGAGPAEGLGDDVADAAAAAGDERAPAREGEQAVQEVRHGPGS